MALTTLPSEDVPPAPSSDVEPLRCDVEGCQNTLEYSGRGRRPTKCDEHKASRSTGDKTGGSKARWAKAELVEQALTRYLNGFAMGVQFVNVKDGTIIAKGAPAVAHELVELGKVDKQLRKYLEWLAMPGKYGPLALSVSAIIIPIMANHGLLPQFFIPIAESGTEGRGSHE